MSESKLSARSQVLLNKVARLHDPESMMLDDLPELVRDLRTLIVELERRVAELEAATIVETPSGLRCAFCNVKVESEDGMVDFTHDVTCPMKGR